MSETTESVLKELEEYLDILSDKNKKEVLQYAQILAKAERNLKKSQKEQAA